MQSQLHMRSQFRTAGACPCRPQRKYTSLSSSGVTARPRRSLSTCRVSAVFQADLVEVAHRTTLALLSGTSSALMSSPDFIQPDLALPLLEPSTAQVLEFDRTIPRSGDVVQYIVRAMDESQQNPALSESRGGSSWAAGGAANLAVAITALPQQMWRSYCWALEAHPLEAKLATGVVGTVLGDGLAQWSASRPASPSSSGQEHLDTEQEEGPLHDVQGPKARMQYDVARCTRQVAYSLLVGTPLCHLWFSFLDQAISPGSPTSPTAVLTKVALDQMLMAPFGTALFFVAMKLLEGTPELVLPSLRSRYLPTLSASYLVWPLAHLINFSLVPASQRILYVNCVAVLWTAYMSHVVNSGSEDEPQVAEAQVQEPVLSARKR